MSEFSQRESESSQEPQIMTFEEYAKNEHPNPYVFEVEKGNKKITYFGAAHSNDPENPMFQQLKEKFQEANPQIVFVEGMYFGEGKKDELIEEMKVENPEKVIKNWGEPGFTFKLAADAGVEIDSPEPDFTEEIQHILDKGFGRDEIFAYYMYRQLDQYHRQNIEKPIEEYLERYIKEFKRDSNWQDFDFSIKHLKEIGKQIWGNKKGSITRREESRTDPVPRKRTKWTNVNAVSQESSYFRDKFIVQKIKETIKERGRLFIVFGSSHAVMQEPALRKIFENL